MKPTVRLHVTFFALAILLPIADIYPASFGEDVAFLKQHLDSVLVLADETNQAQIAIVPAYQGRVMTSTATGKNGLSFGWLNRELIASGQSQPHINAFGGEDRFWMGPEGGQFSIFFQSNTPFDLEHWQTPPFIDTEPYAILQQTAKRVAFQHRAQITNRAGTVFNVRIHRTIELFEVADIAQHLQVNLPSKVKAVGFGSKNYAINVGDKPWDKETGALSIWILGMFNPSPETTIIVPFVSGPENELGPLVNDAYFGKVPADRLVVGEKVLFFSGDGQFRSKIGLTPQRSLSVAGSYDAANQVLTIVQFNKPEGITDYVNSMWELQDNPFAGDTINSYNDGPPEPGKKPLGPFYELETSSPAAFLKPQDMLLHIHRTYHFQGAENDLNPIAQTVLGVNLDHVKSALKK